MGRSKTLLNARSVRVFHYPPNILCTRGVLKIAKSSYKIAKNSSENDQEIFKKRQEIFKNHAGDFLKSSRVF
jgi:hypothetical protein